MIERRFLPHFQQSEKLRNCGAACLAMLYHAYGKRGKVKDITERISRIGSHGVQMCWNSLMIQDAERQGFVGMGVSVDSIQSFLPRCLASGFEVIINYRAKLDLNSGHYSLVSFCDTQNIYVNNPSLDAKAGINYAISYEYLSKAMLRVPECLEITRDNTLLVFAPPSHYFDTTNIHHNGIEIKAFSQLLNDIKWIVSPEEHIWVKLQDDLSLPM